MLAETRKWDAEIRDTLFSLVGDRSQWVRKQAIKAITRCAATEEETRYLESLLTRKASDLRRGVLSLLLNMKDQQALASAQRLLGASHVMQRVAGLELLRQLQDAKRGLDQCRAYAEQYRSERSQITDVEESLLDTILGQRQKVANLDDALGLLDPAQRTKPKPPKAKRKRFFGKKIPLITKAAIACLNSLDDLIHDHRTTPVTIVSWDGVEREELLGNLRWGFTTPNPNISLKKDAHHLPLQDVWETWWTQRPKTLRDSDGLELLRALGAPGY